MVWIWKDFEEHLVATTLWWAETTSNWSDCSRPHPVCPCTSLGMGHPMTYLGNVLHSHCKEFFSIYSESTLFQFQYILPHPVTSTGKKSLLSFLVGSLQTLEGWYKVSPEPCFKFSPEPWFLQLLQPVPICEVLQPPESTGLEEKTHFAHSNNILW